MSKRIIGDETTPIFAWLRNHVCTPREGLPEWFLKKFEQENNTASVDADGKK